MSDTDDHPDNYDTSDDEEDLVAEMTSLRESHLLHRLPVFIYVYFRSDWRYNADLITYIFLYPNGVNFSRPRGTLSFGPSHFYDTTSTLTVMKYVQSMTGALGQEHSVIKLDIAMNVIAKTFHHFFHAEKVIESTDSPPLRVERYHRPGARRAGIMACALGEWVQAGWIRETDRVAVEGLARGRSWNSDSSSDSCKRIKLSGQGIEMTSRDSCVVKKRRLATVDYISSKRLGISAGVFLCNRHRDKRRCRSEVGKTCTDIVPEEHSRKFEKLPD
ncbi:hypothetical protein Bbelb_084670 [Branchiostoma belcheri]|nr:hypothetical protein Bbelb_084670 [Branchiostoma belcheri]